MTVDEKMQAVRDYFADITLELAFAVQLADQGDMDDAGATIEKAVEELSDMKALIAQRDDK